MSSRIGESNRQPSTSESFLHFPAKSERNFPKSPYGKMWVGKRKQLQPEYKDLGNKQSPITFVNTVCKIRERSQKPACRNWQKRSRDSEHAFAFHCRTLELHCYCIFEFSCIQPKSESQVGMSSHSLGVWFKLARNRQISSFSCILSLSPLTLPPFQPINWSSGTRDP